MIRYRNTRVSWKVHRLTLYLLLMTFWPMGSKHFNTDGKMWITKETVLKNMRISWSAYDFFQLTLVALFFYFLLLFSLITLAKFKRNPKKCMISCPILFSLHRKSIILFWDVLPSSVQFDKRKLSTGLQTHGKSIILHSSVPAHYLFG